MTNLTMSLKNVPLAPEVIINNVPITIWILSFSIFNFVIIWCLFLLDTCTCSHLANVTASVGEMYCTNDETRYCDTNRECYTTEAFNYGQWEIGGQNNGAICRDLPVTEE